MPVHASLSFGNYCTSRRLLGADPDSQQEVRVSIPANQSRTQPLACRRSLSEALRFMLPTGRETLLIKASVSSKNS